MSMLQILFQSKKEATCSFRQLLTANQLRILAVIMMMLAFTLVILALSALGKTNAVEQ